MKASFGRSYLPFNSGHFPLMLWPDLAGGRLMFATKPNRQNSN
jgi:hypothetical protein